MCYARKCMWKQTLTLVPGLTLCLRKYSIHGGNDSLCPHLLIGWLRGIAHHSLHQAMDGECTLSRIAFHQGITQQDANCIVNACCISSKRLDVCSKLSCSFEKQFFRNSIRGEEGTHP